MRFDINRLSRLAGISGTSTSGNRGLISEAGNRSYNEDPGLSKEVDVLFGKNQLNTLFFIGVTVSKNQQSTILIMVTLSKMLKKYTNFSYGQSA